MKLTQAERLLRRAQKAEKPTPTEKPVEAPVMRAPLAEVPIEVWHRCYDERWAGFLSAESFSHPAKCSRALLGRIYDHLFACGALSKGSKVLDPFGGIGTTGIIGAYRGCAVTCCELEPKFVALARENVEVHRRKWETLGVPIPVIIQGDSRRLRESLRHTDAIVSSPPYAELGARIKGHGIVGAGVSSDPNYGAAEYGDSPGQIGAMKEDAGVDAVVSSPPYIDSVNQGDAANDNIARQERIEKAGLNSKWSPTTPPQAYGKEVGQLGALPNGNIDAVISSPPYAEISTGAGGLNTQPGEAHQQSGRSASAASQDTDQRYGDTAGQLARLEKGHVDAVVSSPPYEESSVISSGVQRNEYAWGSGTDLSAGKSKDYGTTPGQLGALPSDSVDAVISSPPYEAAISERGGRQTATEPRVDEAGHPYPQESQLKPYGEGPGQLGALEPGRLDAVVSSPPFGGQQDQPVIGQGSRNEMTKVGRDPSDRQQSSTGNLAIQPMEPLDAVLSSPPYSGAGLGASSESEGPSGRPTENKGASQPGDQYGSTPGQLNHEPEDTFWSASAKIVQECHSLLRPGGVAVWIVKSFVRDKAVVDFPGDWRRLCEWVGFETVLEVHAMLVRTTESGTNLLGEEYTETRARKSFFRRLHEKKHPGTEIDFEVVYVMRKK